MRLGINLGLGCIVNVLPITSWYLAGVSTNPKYPWFPSPRSVSMELALAYNSVCNLLRALFVGSPCIGVGVLYLK